MTSTRDEPSGDVYIAIIGDLVRSRELPNREIVQRNLLETLDEIGLMDVDGDGMRDLPGGEPLTIALEYVDAETPKQISMELVTSYWSEVGIDVRLRLIDSNCVFGDMLVSDGVAFVVKGLGQQPAKYTGGVVRVCHP